MLPKEEFEIYGKILTTESEIEKAKLARIRFLKLKMRDQLAANIGDDPDNTTDVLKAIVMSYAVSSGVITDTTIKTRLDNYINQLLAGYGGPSAIMDTLEFDLFHIGNHVISKYFVAKNKINSALTEEEIMQIDIDDL